jgi:hypothetical protein
VDYTNTVKNHQNSFTTTSLDNVPLELLIDTLPKNLSNKNEYPGLTRYVREIEVVYTWLRFLDKSGHI